MRVSVAEKLIKCVGGIRATAKRYDRSPSSVCKWTQPTPKGTGGKIPQKLHQQILNDSKKHRWGITERELISGKAVYVSKVLR
jgi:hypothetical protein